MLLFLYYKSNTLLSVLLSSDNFLALDIYYGQLKSQEMAQKPAYDVISFFSK